MTAKGTNSVARSSSAAPTSVTPAKAGVVRLRACMVGEVQVLARYALSGL